MVSNGSLDFCTFELPPEKLYTNNVGGDESLGSFFSDLVILVKKLWSCFFPRLSLLHDPCALHKDSPLVHHTRTNISIGLNLSKDLSTFCAVKILKKILLLDKTTGASMQDRFTLGRLCSQTFEGLAAHVGGRSPFAL